jgi:hypothetical protein
MKSYIKGSYWAKGYAVGDSNAGTISDMLSRLWTLIPNWFSDSSPIINALFDGYAYTQNFIYSLIQYAIDQTRISTATGGWLDMIAYDFFGSTVLRKQGQSDDSFRADIILDLFQEKATRKSINRVITYLTGSAPVIFEPLHVPDTGAYGAPNCGYGKAGGYGSELLPYQAFIQVNNMPLSNVPFVAGYDESVGAYNTASRAEYVPIKSITGTVTDAQIYSALDRIKPAGTILWVNTPN